MPSTRPGSCGPGGTTEAGNAALDPAAAPPRSQSTSASPSQAGLDKPQPTDLSTVAGRALLAPRPDVQRFDIQVDTTIASAPLRGDPRLLEALAVKLIDNAIKYNHQGGHVHVATSVRDGQAVLTVTNTGPVVPAAAVELLLQPFQGLGSQRTGHGKGLGLDLSIAAAIATAHNAKLALHPRPEGGLDVEIPSRP